MRKLLSVSQAQAAEIFRRGSFDLAERHAAQLGELARGFDEESRFIALTAFGYRGEIGRIGFDQNAVGGRDERGFLNVDRLWESDDPAEAQVESEIERLASLVRALGKAMHDAGTDAVIADECDGVLPRLAGVNHDWFVRFERYAHLSDEHVTLDFARGKIVVVIETDFADGDNARVLEQIAQSRESFRGRFGGVVRMDSDGGVEARIPVRQPDSGFEIRRAVAGSDGHHRLHARGQRALNYLVAVIFELVAIEMAMGVDHPARIYFNR
ncbi:MAG TPA: hypothetical protein VMG40_01480, partial [Bryobacteraceae bacterium]|nr:hypothetical protein [Bryobacteraceae bacterium]